jgi:hypothetical protein
MAALSVESAEFREEKRRAGFRWVDEKAVEL